MDFLHPDSIQRRRSWITANVLPGVVTLLLSATALGDVRLPALFGDHMILQRERPLRVWGWADPGEEITVTLANQSVVTTTDDNGDWQVELAAESTARGLVLRVTGKNSLECRDVAIGEVWVCSGQSNMQWPVSAAWNADLTRLTADRSDLRLISIPSPGSQTPQDDFDGKWERATPDAVAQFSAVGYYFGSRLADVLDVPIGLIDNAWGGSAAEAWTPRGKLEADSRFEFLMNGWAQKEQSIDYEKEQSTYDAKLANWRRQVERAIERGYRPPERPFPRGESIGNHRPGNLFNARVAPIASYAIRGVIWYQGESNVRRAAEYRELFPLLIESWREEAGQGEFSFYWVQLADFLKEATGPSESNWAALREAQTMTLDRLTNTGQAVIIDLGEAADIHPRNKQEVANRLVRWALAKNYGVKIAHASPRFDSIAVEGGKAIITLRDVSGSLRTVDAEAVQGFAIAGEDHAWRPAKANIIDKDRVEVWTEAVAKPVAVRYAWANNPVCNLYDTSGLPVTPFRTDAWPAK